MRLWTIQEKRVYDEICAQGFYIRRWCEKDAGVAAAYRWMVKRMVARIGKGDAVYPVWAWMERPDLRWVRFSWGKRGTKMALLELEIDDRRVVLSDHDQYNCVYGAFCSLVEGKADPRDYCERMYDVKTSDRQSAWKAMNKEWEKVFDSADFECVQATFWKINREDVVSAKFFESRSKYR